MCSVLRALVEYEELRMQRRRLIRVLSSTGWETRVRDKRMHLLLLAPRSHARRRPGLYAMQLDVLNGLMMAGMLGWSKEVSRCRCRLVE